MNPDEANEAATGLPIHREAPETPYVPVKGIPGSTLVEQYAVAQEMIEEGDLTDRQGKAIMRRLVDAFPGVNQRGAEFFIATMAEAVHTFDAYVPPADRAYILFRLKHCACGECEHIYGMFSAWFEDDGTKRPGALFG